MLSSIRGILAYPIPQLLEDIHFNQRLLMKSFFITDYFDGNQATCSVIYTAYHLTEAALPKNINDFVPIRQVIACHYVIVSSFIVIPKIDCFCVEVADMFLGIVSTAEVDVTIVHDLATLKDVEIGCTKGMVVGNPLLRRCSSS